MEAVLPTTTSVAPVAAPRSWTGRVLSAMAILFLIFDGAIKVLQLAPAVDGSVQLGYPADLTLGLGLLELACLAVYVLPRTAFLGAVVLTGYLGGAIASQVRIDAPLISVVFPLIVAALLWGGLSLRDARLRALLAAR